jgi:hypothetical protein
VRHSVQINSRADAASPGLDRGHAGVDGGRGRRDTLSACVPGTMWGTASSKTAKFKIGAVPGSPETQAFTPLSVSRSGGPQSACLTPSLQPTAAIASADPGAPSNPKIAVYARIQTAVDTDGRTTSIAAAP